ncbi:hypothetical protein B0H21DRAFT_824845 [Amylocystis lapponica]|nr:hypothetical protein B0H21DRAFT_824845 [Amylocystis lapponica]
MSGYTLPSIVYPESAERTTVSWGEDIPTPDIGMRRSSPHSYDEPVASKAPGEKRGIDELDNEANTGQAELRGAESSTSVRQEKGNTKIACDGCRSKSS